jgi:hypothetical protein
MTPRESVVAAAVSPDIFGSLTQPSICSRLVSPGPGSHLRFFMLENPRSVLWMLDSAAFSFSRDRRICGFLSVILRDNMDSCFTRFNFGFFVSHFLSSIHSLSGYTNDMIGVRFWRAHYFIHTWHFIHHWHRWLSFPHREQTEFITDRSPFPGLLLLDQCIYCRRRVSNIGKDWLMSRVD